jgi:hypothetical protein
MAVKYPAGNTSLHEPVSFMLAYRTFDSTGLAMLLNQYLTLWTGTR